MKYMCFHLGLKRQTRLWVRWKEILISVRITACGGLKEEVRLGTKIRTGFGILAGLHITFVRPDHVSSFEIQQPCLPF